jgi:hypothetical protein
MAEQADVFVKNKFENERDIVVTRVLPDESRVNTTIAYGNEEKFPSLVPEESLIINVPDGEDTKNWPIVVRSSIIDLKVTHSSTNWTFRIIPNDLPPEVPTTVNITPGSTG